MSVLFTNNARAECTMKIFCTALKGPPGFEFIVRSASGLFVNKTVSVIKDSIQPTSKKFRTRDLFKTNENLSNSKHLESTI